MRLVPAPWPAVLPAGTATRLRHDGLCCLAAAAVCVAIDPAEQALRSMKPRDILATALRQPCPGTGC